MACWGNPETGRVAFTLPKFLKKKMKVQQIVEFKPSSFYCGWACLEFSDENGNQVKIDLSDNQIELLAERLTEKSKKVRKDRLEKLKTQLEDLEDASSDS